MPSVETNTETLTPWAEINSMLTRARRLRVCVGEMVLTGPVRFSEQDGTVTIAFPAPQPQPRIDAPKARRSRTSG